MMIATRFAQRARSQVQNGPALQYALLIALEVKLLWGSWRSWDLPLWDGSTYFIYSRRLITEFRFPPFDWSPLFAAFYSIFHLFLGSQGPLLVYAAHRWVTIIAAVLLVYSLLRKLVADPVAWLMAAYFALLSINFTTTYAVHLFLVVTLLLTYLACYAMPGRRKGLILSGLMLCTGVRTEYLLAVVVALAIWWLMRFIATPAGSMGTKSLRQNLVAFMPSLIVGAIITIMLILAGPSHSDVPRTWGAFGQHYAVGYRERNPGWQHDPYLQWEEATRQSFGTANSVLQATRQNPAAVAEHVAWNARLLPAAIRDVLSPAGSMLWLGGVLVLGLLGFLGGAIQRGWANWRRVPCTSSRQQLPEGNRWVAFVCLLTAIPVLGTALAIRPRVIYLIPIVPPILICASLGLEHWTRWLRLQRALPYVVPMLAAATLIVAPMQFNTAPELMVVPGAATLASIEPAQPYGLLAESARGFCAYSGSDHCRGVEIFQVPAQTANFEQYLQAQDIRVIFLSQILHENMPPSGQDYLTDLSANPGSMGWEAMGGVGRFSFYRRR